MILGNMFAVYDKTEDFVGSKREKLSPFKINTF